MNNVQTSGPIHGRPTFRRPTLVRTTAADVTAHHFGWLRSSCGRRIGWAWVRHGRQTVIQWAVCR